MKTDFPSYDVIPASNGYSAETLQIIGEFFLECARAEVALLFVLAELQSHPNKITLNALNSLTGMANKVMLEKISTSIAIVSPQHHTEIDHVCKKIRSIFDQRNDIAHNTGIAGQGDIITVTPIRFRANTKAKPKNFHRSDLTRFAERLRQLIRHLSTRLREIGFKGTAELEVTPLNSRESGIAFLVGPNLIYKL